jgi:hypothetical protein
MIENLSSQLVAGGMPAGQIHSEEFGFAKLGRNRRGAEAAPDVRETQPRPSSRPEPR